MKHFKLTNEIKVNFSGDTLWTKNFGDNTIEEWSGAIVETPDKGFFICGTKHTITPINYIIKVDSLGNELFTKQYQPYSLIDEIQDVILTSDSNYIARTFDRIIKFDNNGDTIWTKELLNGVTEENSILDNNNGTFSILNSNYTITTIDNSGNVLTTKAYQINGNSKSWIKVSNEYFVLGHNGSELNILKTNSNGDSLWTKTYSDSGILNASASASIGFCNNSFFIVYERNIFNLELLQLNKQGDSIYSENIPNINTENQPIKLQNFNSNSLFFICFWMLSRF